MSAPPPHSRLFTELRRLSALSYLNAYSQLYPATTAPSTSNFPSYNADLQATNTHLRRLVLDEEMAIASLQPQLPTDDNKKRRLRAQLSANKQAFAEAGYIPLATSPLNLLLAYRYVVRAITSTADTLPHLSQRLEAVEKSLADAKALQRDHQALNAALEQRLGELEDPSIGARGEGSAALLKVQAKEVRKRTVRTMKALQEFFGTYLVPLLEIEELGGPVTGLGSEEVDGKKVLGRKKGQMTLEEAFSARRGEETEGVAEEMGTLLEELMNNSLEADSYVNLPRESAVARFLVRAKVAEFHPRDARKIRLVDFAGSFE